MSINPEQFHEFLKHTIVNELFSSKSVYWFYYEHLSSLGLQGRRQKTIEVGVEADAVEGSARLRLRSGRLPSATKARVTVDVRMRQGVGAEGIAAGSGRVSELSTSEREVSTYVRHLPVDEVVGGGRQRAGGGRRRELRRMRGESSRPMEESLPKTCVVDETAFFASRWCASEVRGRRTRELLGDAMEDDFFQVKAWYSGSESDTWVMFELERRTRGRRGGTVVEEAFETVPDSGL
ncbi:hypothetical protein R3P38DRAFT_2781450 [Favolaschia claudopus]|uniref:Uncharacterized protein n=1 Tax=Favolaschia claudopus TaxID=2862362 RepID=A0AAW0B591_9AGAR